MMLQIAVLASGSGSNAESLVRYCRDSDVASVKLIVTNNPKAGVIERAKRLNVDTHVFSPKTGSQEVLTILNDHIDVVVLAGYLQMIPKEWTQAFQGRMLNIHPSLLPRFGGKGMYGKHVHKAVSESGINETGITIHLVNEAYDEGAVIAQYKVDIEPGAVPEIIEERVRELELEYYGPTIERWIEQLALGN
ncbi:MAG: phosphoribosylglycinamide formyltransferase [Bacteroidetes bacterium]|nr:phosphoribosylglycinamide formyltransferase [Bacteroidota bacterium]